MLMESMAGVQADTRVKRATFYTLHVTRVWTSSIGPERESLNDTIPTLPVDMAMAASRDCAYGRHGIGGPSIGMRGYIVWSASKWGTPFAKKLGVVRIHVKIQLSLYRRRRCSVLNSACMAAARFISLGMSFRSSYVGLQQLRTGEQRVLTRLKLPAPTLLIPMHSP